MVVTDRHAVAGRLEDAVTAALVGGASAIQLREKDLGANDLLDLALAIKRQTADLGRLLIVNDRVDVALAAGADGVHLGWRSMPIARVRDLVGADRLIGMSTHEIDEARRAADAGADYVVFGPVFPTPSKEGILDPCGLDAVRAVADAISPVPVIAIGGLDGSRTGAVMRTGAAGVGVIRAVLAAPDVTAAAQEIFRIATGATPDDGD